MTTSQDPSPHADRDASEQPRRYAEGGYIPGPGATVRVERVGHTSDGLPLVSIDGGKPEVLIPPATLLDLLRARAADASTPSTPGPGPDPTQVVWPPKQRRDAERVRPGDLCDETCTTDCGHCKGRGLGTSPDTAARAAHASGGGAGEPVRASEAQVEAAARLLWPLIGTSPHFESASKIARTVADAVVAAAPDDVTARLRAKVERERQSHATTAEALDRTLRRAEAAEAEVERLAATVERVRALVERWDGGLAHRGYVLDLRAALDDPATTPEPPHAPAGRDESASGQSGEGEALRDAESGAALIAAERQRQITEEGYTAEHDENHAVGQFVSTAIVYLGGRHTGHSPWPVKAADPGDMPGYYQRRDLVKAGALIAAALDRLRQAEEEEVR